MTATVRVDTVVIGAGQAGLSASYWLTRHGRDHLVLERGRVGETWRSQRWDGFYLNTPNWTQRLPGFEYQGPEPDAFASLAETIECLESYRASFGAPVRENVEVTRVRRDGPGFVIETSADSFAARHVVIAAGAYQKPTPSPLMGAVPRRVMSLHTSEYRRPGQLPDGAVVIVGSGQSGCQIAEELLAAGRSVTLSVGRCPWLPRRYRGVELMRWMIDLGLADQTVETLPSPEARLLCNVPVSGNDGGHDCNPRTLARGGAGLVGRIEAIDGEIVRVGPGVEESLAAGDAFVAGFRRMADEYVRTRGLSLGDPEPDEPVDPVPAVESIDLRASKIGTVLWANGFRPDYRWIDGLETDPLGWPVHRRGVSTTPEIYFVGMHWLHKRKSALLLGVGEDAEHVIGRLAGDASRRAGS